MLTVGQIATREARSQFESLGTDILIVRLTPGGGEHLSIEDATRFARLHPTVSTAAPVALGPPQVSYAGQPVEARELKGVTEDYLSVNRLSIAEGKVPVRPRRRKPLVRHRGGRGRRPSDAPARST